MEVLQKPLQNLLRGLIVVVLILMNSELLVDGKSGKSPGSSQEVQSFQKGLQKKLLKHGKKLQI
jgi:hypothetical protein